MLTEVYANGYRSLDDITIPLKRGLNVLVGPNGGGKTNILSFFEFLSKLVESPVDEAVSSNGGIGRVFSRIEDNKYRKTLDARLRGFTMFRTRSGLTRILWYTWKFSISASENYDEIEYKSQRLYINPNREPKNIENSDLIICMSPDESGARLTIERMVISRLQHFFHGFEFVNLPDYISVNYAKSLLNYYSRGLDLWKECIINAFAAQVPVFRQIARDIQGGEIFNFVPEVCKQPEDSARPPIMDKNGAGLAATLHGLAKPSRLALQIGPRRSRRRVVNAQSMQRLNKISNYAKLISYSVEGVRTEQNPIDNTISVFVEINEGDHSISFPLAHCSDGTVKWIALLTKIMTATSGFSIEEPENFLHPNVQKEFLQVVRAESKDLAQVPFTLLTTHSESLLNEASPDEVILVWMDAGKTVAKRVSNVDELVDEINRTGFGLGHYYTSGALEGA